MSDSIRVSYLTTNYNKNDVIKQSLESLLFSLPTDGELIVVDGGSTDGSVETLRELEATHDRLRVYVEESNLGEGRQIAANHSRGDILVQHLDTDRRYDNQISSFVDIFEQTEREEDISDLVLMTFDSIYIMRPDTMKIIGGWPAISRVEERIFVDRIENSATPRILPVQISEELPSADRGSFKGRVTTWRDTSRDLIRAGFDIRQLVRWNHCEFPLRKALLADLISIYAGLTALPREQYTNDRRSWKTIESWQKRYVVTGSGRERYEQIKLTIPEELEKYMVEIDK
jgi:glycosyltransferase involved in cell wall biosynthesis